MAIPISDYNKYRVNSILLFFDIMFDFIFYFSDEFRKVSRTRKLSPLQSFVIDF